MSVIQILGHTGSIWKSWPESKNLPDYNKIEFSQSTGEGLDSILPESICDKKALTMISKILIYSSCQRLTAEEILKCEFLTTLPLACHWSKLPVKNKYDNSSYKASKVVLNEEEAVYRELETIDLEGVEDFDDF